MYPVFAIAIVTAYFIGSIPFGLIIAKAHGKDLRSIGSGNIGATNVSRALGRKWGYICFLLDVLKGLIPMLAMLPFASPISVQTPTQKIIILFLWLAVGCAAILGHIFPIYVKFKGGKGVATSFGIALGLWPYYTICAFISILLWIAIVLIWRYISLASIIAAISFPIAFIVMIIIRPYWQISVLWPLLIPAISIPAMVIFRHRENIKRLKTGSESKVLSKKN
ncbi:MAG: glycerol-3-phosphate 1-O-acyltransferase PlsY [Sedimentisphaerales bacterium]|nr:glycerol-3-phosphate 1-O-acyltransferase PlsY [Sedimentisphaerales bacterium]